MSPTPFKVDTAISPDKITNCLVTAFETNVCSWLATAHILSDTREDTSKTWYVDEDYISSPTMAFEVVYDGKDDFEGTFASKKVVTYGDIAEGLAKMAVGNPYQFGLLLADDGDATTADVLMQFVILGEEIYG